MKHYTWRDWYEAHRGMALLWVHWDRYSATYSWWNPRRHKVGGLVREAWYYLRCRLWTRYHVVTVKTLPPTWQDADERLLHTCFHILGDVIHKERIFERNGAEGDPKDGKSLAWALGEMQELWTWWTIHRPAREAEYDRLLSEWDDLRNRDMTAHKAAYPKAWEPRNGLSPWPSLGSFASPQTLAAWEALNQLDDSIRDAEDNAMLKRLIDIRLYLWT